jgi:hypothetical protein
MSTSTATSRSSRATRCWCMAQPITVPYGETHTERRTATVTRASLVERLWTRATGDLEFMELCEFSFSEEARL